MIILHAVNKPFWDTYEEKAFYGEDSLNRYGFIHCSDIDTYHFVAPNFKAETDEMVLLLIDTEKVTPPIRWEDLRNCGTKYPHIYGLLNKDAVASVLPHLWSPEKEWIMNEELKELLDKK